MASKANLLNRVTVRFRRSSLLTKYLVLTTLIVTTAVLLTLTIGIRNAQEELEKSRREAAALEQQNAQLEENIQNIGSVESDKELAQEHFGLVDPDTVVFSPEN